MPHYNAVIRTTGERALDFIKLSKGQKYNVVIRITDKELATLATKLGQDAVLQGMDPVVNPQSDDPIIMIIPHDIIITTTGRGYVGGIRNKGISGRDLVLEVLTSANRPFNFSEISNAFVQRGFAGNSASPNLTVLVKEGKIRNLGHGKWELIRHTHHSSER